MDTEGLIFVGGAYIRGRGLYSGEGAYIRNACMSVSEKGGLIYTGRGAYTRVSLRYFS